MPYPPRPQLRPLPAFAGTARNGTVPSQRLQAQLEAFVLVEYAAGRSLRQIAELIDRSPTRGPPRARQAPGAAARRRRSTVKGPRVSASDARRPLLGCLAQGDSGARYPCERAGPMTLRL